MSTDVWQRLSIRDAAGGEGLREGVPASMRRPLRKWIWAQALMYGSAIPRIRSRLGLPENTNPDRALHDWLAYDTRAKDLLDIADSMLSLMPSTAELYDRFTDRGLEVVARKQALQELLDDERSIYTIKENGSGLERRASATATATMKEAIESASAKPNAGSAVAHLRVAWDTAHALKPEPDKAYSHAIRAVESAAHALVEPNNAKATLGTMIRHLRANPGQFSLAISADKGDVLALVSMMHLLWTGQTSRHGGKEPTRPETPEEARMAVQLAVTLVEWFTSGAVRRV